MTGWAAVVVLAALLSVGLSGCHTIDTTTMPRMYVGLGVWMPMRSTGGAGPLTWSATGLPPGLTIDSATGAISGNPTTAGTFAVTVSAVDPASDNATATTAYAIEVSTPLPVDVVQPLDVPYQSFGAVISDDGRFVAYATTDPQYRTDPDWIGPAYVLLDRTTRARSLVFYDEDGFSDRISISGNGRYVAFVDNPPTTSGLGRIGVWDRETQATEFIPDVNGATSFNGAFSPVLSDDGRYVAYIAAGGSTGHVFVYDRAAGSTTQVTRIPVQMESAALSGDGSTVAFATPTSGVVDGDDDSRCDVFVWDRATGTTERITDNALGDPFDVAPTPSLSADGTSVAFAVDLGVPGAPYAFVLDRTTDVTEAPPTRGNRPMISSDGRRVLYVNQSTTVPAGGSTLVVWDRSIGSVRRTGGGSFILMEFAFSGDGRHRVGGGHYPGPDMSVWELLD